VSCCNPDIPLTPTYSIIFGSWKGVVPVSSGSGPTLGGDMVRGVGNLFRGFHRPHRINTRR
jgi:hypothetical protein